jgi:hypothetical protein
MSKELTTIQKLRGDFENLNKNCSKNDLYFEFLDEENGVHRFLRLNGMSLNSSTLSDMPNLLVSNFNLLEQGN